MYVPKRTPQRGLEGDTGQKILATSLMAGSYDLQNLNVVDLSALVNIREHLIFD